MNRSLRIVVADDERDTRDFFQEFLSLQGHRVLATAQTGRHLVEQCRLLHPDLAITDIKMPDMDGIDAAGEIYKDAPIPVILVSTYHNRELIERAALNHVLAYLVKPIKETELEPAIAIAMKRFAEFEALRKDTVDLRQALEDRKVIERAKGVIMRRAKLEEAEAFRRLQRLACDKSRKLVEIAQMILVSEEAIQLAEKA